jgi:hypothetical protein
MKKNFTQPFKAEKTRATLLIELPSGLFVHYTYTDELDLFYANLPYVELDESKDVALQLAKFIHEQGLALLSYRELSRETAVSYSLIDDTPGEKKGWVCLHVRVDKTKREIVAPGDYTLELGDLNYVYRNLDNGVAFPELERVAISQLLREGITHSSDYKEEWGGRLGTLIRKWLDK